MSTLSNNIATVLQELPGSQWTKGVIEKMAREIPRGVDSTMGWTEFTIGLAGISVILPINGVIATVVGTTKAAIRGLRI